MALLGSPCWCRQPTPSSHLCHGAQLHFQPCVQPRHLGSTLSCMCNLDLVPLAAYRVHKAQNPLWIHSHYVALTQAVGQEAEGGRKRGSPELPTTMRAGTVGEVVAKQEPMGCMLMPHGMHAAIGCQADSPSLQHMRSTCPGRGQREGNRCSFNHSLPNF